MRLTASTAITFDCKIVKEIEMSSILNGMVARGVTGPHPSGSKKCIFHKTAKRLLAQIARNSLRLLPNQYDLSSNMGGPAVSGEITLHTDALYIQVSESPFGPVKANVLVRRCVGRKDFCGEQNHYCDAELLENPEGFNEWLQRRGLIPLDADRYGFQAYNPNFQPAL